MFHDTEGLPEFHDVQRALWKLSDFYEGARCVYAIRVDPKTIFASFNTASIPHPVQLERWVRDEIVKYEWIGDSKLKGWLVDDIKNPKTIVKALNYDDMYQGCLQLERSMGECPCPRLKEGSCYPITIGRMMPRLLETIADFGNVEPARHQNTTYKEICGFEYTPGLYLIDGAFVDAIRPWDNYDFSLVPARKKEFKERGENRARRHLYRKETCSQCAFKRTQHDDVIDCGRVDFCERSTTEAEIEELLWRWLGLNTPFRDGSEGFLPQEIKFLMKHSGVKLKSAALSDRTIDIRLAGFRSYGNSTYQNGITYKIVADRGDLSRNKEYSTYTDLREAVPMLPDPLKIPYTEIHDNFMLAHAVFSQVTQRFHGIRGKAAPVYGIYQHLDQFIDLRLYKDTKKLDGVTYNFGTPFSTLYQLLWPWEQEQVWAKSTTAMDCITPRIKWREYNPYRGY